MPSDQSDDAMRIDSKYGLVTKAEFLALRRWTAQELARAVAASKVFCILREGVEYIPDFLADQELIEAGIERVCMILSSLPPGSKLQFFASKKASLNAKTPLEVLAKGKSSQVRQVARGFLER